MFGLFGRKEEPTPPPQELETDPEAAAAFNAAMKKLVSIYPGPFDLWEPQSAPSDGGIGEEELKAIFEALYEVIYMAPYLSTEDLDFMRDFLKIYLGHLFPILVMSLKEPPAEVPLSEGPQSPNSGQSAGI